MEIIDYLYKLYKKDTLRSIVLDIKPTIISGKAFYIKNNYDACLFNGYIQRFREERRIINLKEREIK